ncbi:MAG: DNA-binding MarR family transcriptional regulator [Methylophilaceae bacterium]
MVDLANQINGHNNGGLCLAYSVLKMKGWRSPSTLSKAIKELLDKGLIEVTRKGDRNVCALYAVTFHAVDECKGKHCGESLFNNHIKSLVVTHWDAPCVAPLM